MQLTLHWLFDVRQPQRSRFTSVLSSSCIAVIASFAEASRLFKNITNRGLAGFAWRCAFPVPVLIVVMEETVLREAELELVMTLEARRFSLVAEDVMLNRLGAIFSRWLPSGIDALAVLTEVWLERLVSLLGVTRTSSRLLPIVIGSMALLSEALLPRLELCIELDATEAEVEELEKGCGNHNWSLPCSSTGVAWPEMKNETVTIAWS
jgi:hypothetical protein